MKMKNEYENDMNMKMNNRKKLKPQYCFIIAFYQYFLD